MQPSTGPSLPATGIAPASKTPIRFRRPAPSSRLVNASRQARGQGIELYIGKNRIALDQSTVVIVGDDDPTTEAGTFQLVSGAIDVTVGQGELVTIDAPRLQTTSTGADFSVTTSDKMPRSPS